MLLSIEFHRFKYLVNSQGNKCHKKKYMLQKIHNGFWRLIMTSTFVFELNFYSLVDGQHPTH